MTDILVAIAIVVGVVCLVAVIAVGLKVKNSSAGQSERRLEELARMMVKLEAAVAENSRLVQAQEGRVNDMKRKLDEDLRYIADSTAKGVESIRLSVEQKLSATLEGTLSKSYSAINEQLEKVYKGIGEVNSLAAGVSDIKKLFSNVKLRGTWGEVQLGTLLSQMLAPNQYASSVKVDPRSDGMVDFAIRLPSRDERSVETKAVPRITAPPASSRSVGNSPMRSAAEAMP